MSKQSWKMTQEGPMPPLCLGVIVERYGEMWCCDKDVDVDGDLEEQGCWFMDEPEAAREPHF